MSTKNLVILTSEQIAAENSKANAIQGVLNALGDLDGQSRVAALGAFIGQIPQDINGEQAEKLLGKQADRRQRLEGITLLGPKVMPDLPAESAAKLLKDLSGKDRLDAINALYKR
jgi:hypothetical protein